LEDNFRQPNPPFLEKSLFNIYGGLGQNRSTLGLRNAI